MVEELSEFSAGQFETVSQLLASSVSLQMALAVLVVGLIIIVTVYRKFSSWIQTQKFSYTRPHISRFARTAMLAFFAIGLVSSVNAYIQAFELFDEQAVTLTDELSPSQTFAKILNTINILVIGYTISHLIPIALNKREKTILEREDFESWKELKGFKDDDGDLFHKIFKWVPPKILPEDLTKEEFEKNLQTKEGLDFLENYRTSKGVSIGSYEKLVSDPLEEWKKSVRKKYEQYFDDCISGNNQAGRKLVPGTKPQEIYPIDVWREEKRQRGYDPIIPASKPSGHAELQEERVPKSAKQVLPIGIFVATVIGVVGWWGVDLFILATATGGMALGVGLALKETMENYFAYILIRKDKIFTEGDRVQLESGYNGYVHRITPRVTYVRHGLNESLAIIPTRQLVSAEIINYTKEIKLVPAIVDVGVSYLNDPKQVAAILVKVGKRALIEVKDSNGHHVARQTRCPYLDQNKPSCGCDKDIHVDIAQPTVRFNKFNDSSLDFAIIVYVRDYGSQFKMKSDMRVIMYEEFKKYDIRIPWPIRTVYQGDEKREANEIAEHESKRKQVIDEFGIGDLARGEGD
ncbi:MAG: mechanosensitive ion channel [Thermoproteota archaeon]|uniref:Mechanosensitive ion channel (MscS) n=9 Tax=root TaxID=1 RepID=A0A075HU61_9ARCH|nr:mechanosensitive ion channel (MscS) [uncultured marine thaumarchaeote KM3_168_H11]AIF16735.1 mechanosensitive ion channel (MscS) [uncultured marine thaumarchaeote KM3_74_G09]AIF17383.1 mechanosensitive ion channel (MscS) [uncultured marine thaumarchaeote KM3_77_D12]AIF18366.1 mechanosensitive ion channel (MscS) [uncultured marine thaumarchaeote KM3_82_D11]AIF19268.1 mechanosensitive ion channel (MscS) [uncultured marine thaumarchaeote KM3_86_D01]MEA2044889.1 mechanosensitive ion channel [Th